ncbi:MAG: response regulator [Gammaproteobacteria bacterium]|nr:response regulator [Gammaproteobacteria bacterium]
MNRSLTALIADDSASIRLVLSITLSDAGIKVIEASNGQEALAAAEKQQFDFVITDINMPVMDGVDLIKQLRTLPNYRFTPILTLTNLNSDNIKQQLKDAGATGWVQKPFGPQNLLKTIEKLAA